MLLCWGALWLCSPAHADRGDWTTGGAATVYLAPQSQAVSAQGIVEWGFCDYAAVRLQGGPTAGLQAPACSGEVSAGITFMWDVLRWVPAASLTGGVTLQQRAPPQMHYDAAVQLRSGLTPSAIVGPQIGVARGPAGWQLVVGAMVLKRL